MDVAAVLADVDLLAQAEPDALQRLAARCETTAAEAGRAIVREGERGDSLYAITSGEARVVVGGRPRRDLTAGDVFGEISVLDGRPRSASVYAVSRVEAVVLPAEALRAELARDRDLAWAVVLGLCDRLRHLERDRWAEAEEARLRELQQLFLANVGHELRTPLTVALSGLQLSDRLLDTPDKLRRVLATAQDQLRHLHGLIEDVLELASARRSDGELDRSEEPLAQLVEAAIAESRIAAGRVVVTGGEDLVLPVDGPRIRRALAALLSNADKFGPDGGPVTIAVAAADDHVAIDVTDAGPGIPADERLALFDPFNQRDPSATRAKGGMGIGLSLARTAVQRHGGDLVYVEDAPTTTFRVTLPR